MSLMAHRIPGRNVIPNDNSLSMIPPRGELNYRNYYRHELSPLHAEELLRKKEREREVDAPPFPPQKHWPNEVEMRRIPPELQDREWLLQQEQEYQKRKHMEQDAYYKANQEYVRLMKENQSRQSFREKQRLTEDLEKQKRLLIEDLARDQQLLQDKYKRNQPYVIDPRGKQIYHEKGFRQDTHPVREHERLPTRAFPRSTHPFNARKDDPRLPPAFANMNDMYGMGPMSAAMLQNNDLVVHGSMKHHLNTAAKQQCQHSDLTHAPNSLIPIIQEKERKIKEMEEKLSKFTNEQNVSHQERGNDGNERKNITSIAVNNNLAPVGESESDINDSENPTDFSGDNLIIDVTGESAEKSVSKVEDEAETNETKPIKNSQESAVSKLEKEDDFLDKKKDSSELETEQERIKIDVSNHIPIKAQSNDAKELSAKELAKSDENESVIENDDTMKIPEEENMLPKETTNNHEAIPENVEHSKPTGTDADSQEKDSSKPHKKKQKQKTPVKKPDEDFKTNQSRVALDLPNHNWLVEKLMQQNKLGENDVVQNTSNKSNIKEPSTKEVIVKENSPKDTSAKETSVKDASVKHVLAQDTSAKDTLAKENLAENSDYEETSGRCPDINDSKDSSAKENNAKELNDTVVGVKNKSVSSEERSSSKNVLDSPVADERDDNNIDEIKILSVMSLKEGHRPKDGNDNIIHVETTNKTKMISIDKAVTLSDNDSNLKNKDRIDDHISDDIENNKPKTAVGNLNNDDKRKIQISVSNEEPKENSIPSTLLLKMLHPSTSPATTSPRQVPPRIENSSTLTAFKSILPKNVQSIDSSPPMLIKNDSNSTMKESKVKEHISNLNMQSKSSALKRKSPMLVQSSSAPPSRLSEEEMMKSKFHRRAQSETGHSSEHLTMYQDIRPNLVLMTRRESENQTYPIPRSPPSAADSSRYNKILIEERYNRKRAHSGELPNPQQTASLAEIERNAKIQKLIEMQTRKEEMVPNPAFLERRRQRSEDPSLEERYLYPRQALRYGLQDRAMTAESIDARLSISASAAKPASLLEEQMHHARMQRSPSAYLPSRLAERPPERPYPHAEARLNSALRERAVPADGRFEHQLDPRAPVHESIMLEQLRERERERFLLEESRKQESLNNASDVTRLQRPHQLGMKLEPKELLTKDRFEALNERVRTVDDLRCLQMGLPLENPYRHSNKRAHLLREERLTEREKLALREAELNSHVSMKQDSLIMRQNIHRAYLTQMKHDPAIESKHAPVHVLKPGQLNAESLKILERRKREEEEKLRLLEGKAFSRGPEGRDALLAPPGRNIQVKSTEHGPRFYSHKIPRTRNGSLDFGRSKPVDYSFLDYPPNIQRPEAIPVDVMKRPSSMASSEDWRLARRNSQQTYVSAELYKRLSQNEVKQSEANELASDKWTKNNNSSEKQVCKICGKDAQYLCSGCRKAWYCSQQCQLSEWRTHSTTCAMER